MNAICSPSAGVVLIPKSGTSEYVVFDIASGLERDPEQSRFCHSAAQDWRDIEGSDPTALLALAAMEYWTDRVTSLLRFAINGLEASVQQRVLEHVEELLATKVSSRRVLNRLLIAPLTSCEGTSKLAKFALASGLNAVGSVLDELQSLQPLLSRLVGLWLSLEEYLFDPFSETKEMIWLTVIEKQGIRPLLEARDKREFLDYWNLMAFHFKTPRARSGIPILGNELASRLFPEAERLMPQEARPNDGPSIEETEEQTRTVDIHEAFTQAEKEINGIVRAIARGQDANAKKFIQQLVNRQTRVKGGKEFAVKSLCNIAKQSADLFRVDFEAECLKIARQIDPDDAWMLIQLGDHLKRQGKYDEALKILKQAAEDGERDVAASSVADIYAERGDYFRAIRVYQAIPGWENAPAIRMAVADNLRRSGRTQEALDAYGELIDKARRGPLPFTGSEDRALVGIAEIAKRRGNLDEAMRIYVEVLERSSVGSRDRAIYQLGLCNVLKLKEDFTGAFKVVDEVIAEYPFATQARFIRGSILGLMGMESEGLKDLPETSSSSSWQEWLRPYCRGLLLLKLKRYADARKHLVEAFPNAVASHEEIAILRMAATLWFLADDNTDEAKQLLSGMPDLQDAQAQYLAMVLRLHLAARNEDTAAIKSVQARMAHLNLTYPRLGGAVLAIEKRDFAAAVMCEADALLMIAA